MSNYENANNDGGAPGGNATNQPADTGAGYQDQNQGSGAPIYPTGEREQLTAHLGNLKAKVADGSATAAQHREFRELRDQLYFGGPVPESMRSTPAVDPQAPYDSEAQQIAEAFQPAASVEDYGDAPAMLDGSLSRDEADGLKDIALALRLPGHAFNDFAERFAAHVDEDGEGNRSLEKLDEASTRQMYDAFVERFDGDEQKALTVAAKARTWIESVLPQDMLADFDASISESTLAWDPAILTRLAAMYDAHAGRQGRGG